MTRAHRKDHGPDWVHRLPEILRDRAILCARERKVSPELPALVSLSAVATCLGKGLAVQSGIDRLTRGNVFLLLSAPSGAGKTEVFRDMLGPVVDFETELHRWWNEEARPRARAGVELFKTIITGVRQNVKAARTAALPSFRIMVDLERRMEICTRYLDAPSLLIDDATPEALVLAMDRSSGCIAVASADARQILKRLSITDSKEESLALKGYSGDLSIISRVSRRGVRLRSPCLTLVLLTQPDAYYRFLKKSALTRSGLFPRFLHYNVAPFSGKVSAAGNRKASAIRQRYDRVMSDLLENFRFESEPTEVLATDAAFDLLANLERRCRKEAANDEGICGEVLRRRAEHAWRIALCLHAARCGKAAGSKKLSFADAETALLLAQHFTSDRIAPSSSNSGARK